VEGGREGEAKEAEKIEGAPDRRGGLRRALTLPSSHHFTLSHATPHSDITDKHRRLAEITEMIHTASLVHDDVLDDCDTRRGKEGRGEEGRK